MHQILAYIRYWFHAVNDHSLHSPFLFEFYQKVIKRDSTSVQIEIEQLRKRMLSSHQILDINDLGAGSRKTKSNKRSIRQIARHASTPPRFSQLLFKLIQQHQPTSIVELGTSLGLNTLYLSRANKNANIFTFEGSEAIAQQALNNFEEQKASNITLIQGNIDDTLTTFLAKTNEIDFVYIDANHRYEATTNYFQQFLPKLHPDSIVVIDDIHWSKEMNLAWTEIKRQKEVTISIDLYEAGILFFKTVFPKTDLILKY